MHESPFNTKHMREKTLMDKKKTFIESIQISASDFSINLRFLAQNLFYQTIFVTVNIQF